MNIQSQTIQNYYKISLTDFPFENETDYSSKVSWDVRQVKFVPELVLMGVTSNLYKNWLVMTLGHLRHNCRPNRLHLYPHLNPVKIRSF